MHTCGRMCKDIGVKTTFPRTMGISFRLHPERSRALHPNQSRALHPERSRGVAPRAEPRGWCICIGFLVSASLDEQFERSRALHPNQSRGLHPERSRGGPGYLNTRTCPPLTAPPSFLGAPIATLVPSPEITTLLPQLSPAASPSISVFC